jgi:hypothetical protein
MSYTQIHKTKKIKNKAKSGHFRDKEMKLKKYKTYTLS